jgi:hypothetical protein
MIFRAFLLSCGLTLALVEAMPALAINVITLHPGQSKTVSGLRVVCQKNGTAVSTATRVTLTPGKQVTLEATRVRCLKVVISGVTVPAITPAGSATTTTTPAVSPIGSRANPLALGQFGPYPTTLAPTGWKVRVNSTVPDGTSQVLAANMFNSPPAAAHQFFLINVTFEYDGPGSASATLLTGDLKAVGSAGTGYAQGSNDSCGVTPDDLDLTGIGKDIFTGASITGNVCFSVLSSDAASLKMYVSSNTGQTWFSLT